MKTLSLQAGSLLFDFLEFSVLYMSYPFSPLNLDLHVDELYNISARFFLIWYIFYSFSAAPNASIIQSEYQNEIFMILKFGIFKPKIDDCVRRRRTHSNRVVSPETLQWVWTPSWTGWLAGCPTDRLTGTSLRTVSDSHVDLRSLVSFFALPYSAASSFWTFCLKEWLKHGRS